MDRLRGLFCVCHDKRGEVNTAIIAAIVRIGLDIAKHVFQVDGAHAHDQPGLRKQLKRANVLSFFCELPPSEIGIEACCGAHCWSRELTKLGHTVRLRAPHYVIPYRRVEHPYRFDAGLV